MQTKGSRPDHAGLHMPHKQACLFSGEFSWGPRPAPWWGWKLSPWPSSLPLSSWGKPSPPSVWLPIDCQGDTTTCISSEPGLRETQDLHFNLTSFRWFQPKLGNHSPCHSLTSSVFLFPSLHPTEGSFFPWHPALRCREKSSLTAVLLPGDINTMKEITANFYELSHHLQLINSCWKSRHPATPRRPFTSSMLPNSPTLAVKEGPLLEMSTSPPADPHLHSPPPTPILHFLACPSHGRQQRGADQFCSAIAGPPVMRWFRLAGNFIKIQSKWAAAALFSLPSSPKSGLGLCASLNVSIKLSEQAAIS